MAIPALLLIQVEAVCVDGGCDHDAQAWRGGGAGGRGRQQGWKRSKKNRHLNKRILTGKGLEDARDGESLSFAEGEELSHKHKDAQDGEYTSEHSAGLHCLEVICRGRQRDHQR